MWTKKKKEGSSPIYPKLFHQHQLENNINVEISITPYSVVIEINNKSDLLTVFLFIKNILNLTQFIPESVYTILEPNIKKKKDLYFFKRKNFLEFINLKEQTEGGTLFDSETKDFSRTLGWEIRFKLEPDIKTIDRALSKSSTEMRDLANDDKIFAS